MKRGVLITWISGLAGTIIGAFGGWRLGVALADATPPDSSQPFADLGTVLGTIVLGLVLVPVLAVFLVLRTVQITKPFLSSMIFLMASALLMVLLVRIGTLLLPVNIGIPAGPFLVLVVGTLGGAIAARRVAE